MIKNSNIFIWGAGDNPKGLNRWLLSKIENQYNIVGFIDNNKQKQGMLFDSKYNIFSIDYLEKLKRGEFFIIVATESHFDEIKKQLESKGLEQSIDFEYVKNIKKIYNANRFAFDRYTNKKDGKYYPDKIRIEMSSYCNMKCLYCRYHSKYLENVTNGCNKNLSFDMLKEIVRQINEMGTVKCISNVQKGEMLCNPKWKEMLEYIIKNTNIDRFHFSTNAMLLDDDAVNELLKYDIEIAVTVSIDGTSNEENDIYRHGAKYDIVMKNLNNLLKKTENKPNIKVAIQNAFFLSKSVKEKFNGKLGSNVDFIEKNLVRKVPIDSLPVEIHKIDYVNDILCRELECEITECKLVSNDAMGCPLPLNEITIDSEGYVCMCSCEPNGVLRRIGNIRDEKMIDIWNNNFMNKIRDTYKSGHNVEVCKGCSANVVENSYKVYCK